MTENKKITVKRFPDCNSRENCYKIKGRVHLNSKLLRSISPPLTGEDLGGGRSVAVAMAGRARGAVSAVLDFFAPLFVSRQKVEINVPLDAFV